MINNNSPILITGCGRSGASMIAGVINICGAFAGKLDGADKHFENVEISEQLMTPYLKDNGADPLGQHPLVDARKMFIPINWADRVTDVMKKEGYIKGPWMVKGSRISLMWPVWAYAFPNAKWLIVRRRTGDIIHSCVKTTFMKAFQDVEVQKAVGVDTELDGWLWWVHQYEKRFIEMITEGLNCKVIWPERMIWGDYQQMFETIDWLGLKWCSEALSFIDPKLLKARQNQTSIGKTVEVTGG